MASTFYQLPDGRALDLQGCLISRDGANNVVITNPTGLVTKVQTQNTAAAINLIGLIFAALGLSGAMFSSLQWSSDGSTWKNFPAPTGFITIYLQLNGTALPTGDGDGYSLESNIPGEPVSFNTSSASSTQYTTGSQTFTTNGNGPFNLYVYAGSTGNVILTVPNVITFAP